MKLISISTVFSLLGMILILAGCRSDNPWPDRPGPKVVTSFAPLYCFATNVAGDDAVVKNLMTATGPHDFQPTDTEARLLRGAGLFFVVGLGLDEKLGNDLKTGSGNAGLKLVELGEKIPEKLLIEGACAHDHSGGGQHDHGLDPHVWLSPSRAVLMTEAIRDELKAADPANAAGYDRRAREYIEKLNRLKADGLEMLAKKKDRNLISFHDSLIYFADDFKLEIVGVVQQKAGNEPNSKELEKLVRVCVRNKVRLVGVEPQTGNSAQAVIDELKRKGITDADPVEIDPLETAQQSDLTPDWYERKMRANLEALARTMK